MAARTGGLIGTVTGAIRPGLPAPVAPDGPFALHDPGTAPTPRRPGRPRRRPGRCRRLTRGDARDREPLPTTRQLEPGPPAVRSLPRSRTPQGYLHHYR